MNQSKVTLAEQEFIEELKNFQEQEGIRIKNFNWNSTNKAKSIGRAMRRGKITSLGEKVPKRISNNRKGTKGRQLQEEKLNQLIAFKKILYNDNNE